MCTRARGTMSRKRLRSARQSVQVLRSASVGAKWTSTGCPAPLMSERLGELKWACPLCSDNRKFSKRVFYCLCEGRVRSIIKLAIIENLKIIFLT